MSNTVGSFSIATDGTVTGPADYMACPSGFADIKEKMESGRSAVFNFGGSILVAVQTHYAAWRGTRDMALRFEAVRGDERRAAGLRRVPPRGRAGALVSTGPFPARVEGPLPFALAGVSEGGLRYMHRSVNDQIDARRAPDMDAARALRTWVTEALIRAQSEGRA